MQLTCSGDNELIITGNIKTVDDYMEIRETATRLLAGGCRSLNFHIEDSFSMPSAVIGFLVKLVNRDKIAVSMEIRDKRLFELIQELSLTSLFKARYIPG
jgi:hypothetical protein